MKRFLFGIFAASLFLSPAFVSTASAEGVRQEAREHPRIVKAIRELEDAVAYMKAAPHDFGGHKAAAIQASEAALVELRQALAYRAGVDTRHGR